MTGMGLSYIVMPTAFYVDNGRRLPLWRDLPTLAYWLAPSLVGLPILAVSFLRHPLAAQKVSALSNTAQRRPPP